MYRLEREDFLQYPHIFLWSTLGFQAGFINAFGFLACSRYVSHVTGFGTQIGVALAGNNPFLAFELLGFPISFILGAFTSALFTSARLERQQKPWYGFITLLLPTVLGALWFFGHRGTFGEFAEPLLLFHDFVLLFLLSFVCGMQNGCFATLTKGQIRTTHLTGISTDIGTDFARMWFGKLSKVEYELTKRTNVSRILTFISFTAGSIISIILGNRLGYSSLMVPFFTAIFISIAVRNIHLMLDDRFKQNALQKSTSTDALKGADHALKLLL